MRFCVWDEVHSIQVPEWVNDLESFRRWSDDEAYPEHGRVAYLRGEVFLDIGKVQLFAHNQLKHEITLVLAGIIRAERLGIFFPDGAFLSNQAADVSNQPDGMFVSTEAIRAGRVRIVEGRASGHVELEGSPEMVLEVVSTSSVEKDTIVLRDAYFVAGVQEYWLIDARTEPLRFDLLRRGKTASSPPGNAKVGRAPRCSAMTFVCYAARVPTVFPPSPSNRVPSPPISPWCTWASVPYAPFPAASWWP
jgi:Uma2 family endonuclease